MSGGSDRYGEFVRLQTWSDWTAGQVRSLICRLDDDAVDPQVGAAVRASVEGAMVEDDGEECEDERLLRAVIVALDRWCAGDDMAVDVDAAVARWLANET